jgi:cbb3-type cytochrome oxidase maturation protein
MEIVYLLLPLAILLVVVIAWLFFWAVRSGQFDDLEGPAYRILMDNDKPENIKKGEAIKPADKHKQSGDA